jgi:hypothetical protein
MDCMESETNEWNTQTDRQIYGPGEQLDLISLLTQIREGNTVGQKDSRVIS